MRWIFVIFIAILFFSDLSAQSQDALNKEQSDFISSSKKTKPLQSIDGEILGQGLILSINYDTRFKPSNKGFGLRAGIGFILGVNVPVSVNYLIGNNNRRSFLELGVGGTIYFTNNTYHFFDKDKIIPVSYIMYRYQALKTPNTFRIGITQLYVFGEDYSNYRFYYPTLSLGHILGRRPK